MPNQKKSPSFIADKLPPTVLKKIGEIIYRWSCLQHQFTHMIAYGFCIPIDVSRALTIGMELNVLCGVFRTMTLNDKWIKDAKLRKEIYKLSEDARKCSTERNNYAHSIFVFDLDEPNSFERYLVKKPEHRISPSSEKLDIKKLTKICKDTQELVNRARDLTAQLRASLQKYP
jgi:hypothetical protein